MIKGSLEVKLATIWTDEKQSREEAERREGLEERRVRRKKMQMREKVGKSRNTVFPMIWGSGGSKSRLAKKAAGAEPAGQMRDEKLHAVVARSTFPSQNVQNTPGADHFWQLRCRKSSRRCGAKHISKSKCTKHTLLGPLLEVQMSKKCTPLWREAHFQVKMYKTHQVRTTFGSWDVGKVHAVVARSTSPSQNVQNNSVTGNFWKFRCRKSARRCGAKHISKSKCTKHLSDGPLLEVEISKKCTPLSRSTFRSQNVKNTEVRTTFGDSDVASLRYTTLHYITLHYTPLLRSTTLHYITQHYNHNYTTTQLHNYTPLHPSTLTYTTLHYITLHYTPLHYITLHNTTFHYTSLYALHYNYNYTTTLRYNTLHYTPLH